MTVADPILDVPTVEIPPLPPAVVTYRLAVAHWIQDFRREPQLFWLDDYILETPTREPLEQLVSHVLRLPGIAAVRIVELENGRPVCVFKDGRRYITPYLGG